MFATPSHCRHAFAVLCTTLTAATLQARDPVRPFTDVTEAVGLKGVSGGVAAWGDLDNDGWPDLCAGGEVWRNDKGKRFTLLAKLAGPGVCRSACS